MCVFDKGKEPVCGTHRMVPLSEGPALRPCECDASVEMFASLCLLNSADIGQM